MTYQTDEVLALLTRAPAPVDAVTTQSRARILPLPGTLAELLLGCPVELVFSNEERRHCQRRRDLTGWAGRLAAKLAVAELIDVPNHGSLDRCLREHIDVGLAAIEILPDRTTCTDGPGCPKQHPPQVRFGQRFAGIDAAHFQLSISHTRSRAIALCVRSVERSVLVP
jgi:phosphopantetheinyl transferase (holo-ACP synthase)